MNYFPIKCHFFAVILDLPFYSLLSGPLRETARSQSDSAISTEQLALPLTRTHTHTHTEASPASASQNSLHHCQTASTFHYLHSQASHTHTYTHRKRRNQREQLIKVTSRYHQLLLSSTTHKKHGTSKKGNKYFFISNSFPSPSLLPAVCVSVSLADASYLSRQTCKPCLMHSVSVSLS